MNGRHDRFGFRIDLAHCLHGQRPFAVTRLVELLCHNHPHSNKTSWFILARKHGGRASGKIGMAGVFARAFSVP